ncbi:MAG: SCO family protein [Chitinophagaceae bacterium]|nr:SCO family protein [Chitinophagaceae bacterium]
MKNKASIFLLVFFMLLGIAFLSFWYFQYKQIPKRLPTFGNPGHHVESFSFTNQEGKTVTDKDLQGKIYVVEYFFTT